MIAVNTAFSFFVMFELYGQRQISPDYLAKPAEENLIYGAILIPHLYSVSILVSALQLRKRQAMRLFVCVTAVIALADFFFGWAMMHSYAALSPAHFQLLIAVIVVGCLYASAQIVLLMHLLMASSLEEGST